MLRQIGLCLVLLLSFCFPCLAQETLTPYGKRFIKDAASSNRMEIQLGQLARERASAPEVRYFGEQLELDHGTAGEELDRVAAANNVRLPRQVERKHTVLIERLKDLRGREFDKGFLQTMIKSHGKSIARFKKANRKLEDADLKAWSARYLPALEHHLSQAKELVQTLGMR